MKRTLNINDRVWVRLTAVGREAVRRRGEGGVYVHSAERDAVEAWVSGKTYGGWVEFQLWELMFYIGPTCYMGGQPAIENNEIRLEKP
jgi:hypothetical protein